MTAPQSCPVYLPDSRTIVSVTTILCYCFQFLFVIFDLHQISTIHLDVCTLPSTLVITDSFIKPFMAHTTAIDSWAMKSYRSKLDLAAQRRAKFTSDCLPEFVFVTFFFLFAFASLSAFNWHLPFPGLSSFGVRVLKLIP